MYGGRAGAGASRRRLAVKAVEEIMAALIWNVEDDFMQPSVHKEINRTP